MFEFKALQHCGSWFWSVLLLQKSGNRSLRSLTNTTTPPQPEGTDDLI